jgi:hypothetical protein
MEYYSHYALPFSQLGVSPDRFVGRIMRINVTCENSRRGSPKDMTGVMVFKVNGTFKGKLIMKLSTALMLAWCKPTSICTVSVGSQSW